MEVPLLSWAWINHQLLSFGNSDTHAIQDSSGEGFLLLFKLLIGLVALPVLYWIYVSLLYWRYRSELKRQCDTNGVPIGERTFDRRTQAGEGDKTTKQTVEKTGKAFCGLELGNNLLRTQLIEDGNLNGATGKSNAEMVGKNSETNIESVLAEAITLLERYTNQCAESKFALQSANRALKAFRRGDKDRAILESIAALQFTLQLQDADVLQNLRRILEQVTTVYIQY